MQNYDLESVVEMNCVLYWVVTRKLGADKSNVLEGLFKSELHDLDTQPIEITRAIVMSAMRFTLENTPVVYTPQNEVN